MTVMSSASTSVSRITSTSAPASSATAASPSPLGRRRRHLLRQALERPVAGPGDLGGHVGQRHDRPHLLALARELEGGHVPLDAVAVGRERGRAGQLDRAVLAHEPAAGPGRRRCPQHHRHRHRHRGRHCRHPSHVVPPRTGPSWGRREVRRRGAAPRFPAAPDRQTVGGSEPVPAAGASSPAAGAAPELASGAAATPVSAAHGARRRRIARPTTRTSAVTTTTWTTTHAANGALRQLGVAHHDHVDRTAQRTEHPAHVLVVGAHRGPAHQLARHHPDGDDGQRGERQGPARATSGPASSPPPPRTPPPPPRTRAAGPTRASAVPTATPARRGRTPP